MRTLTRIAWGMVALATILTMAMCASAPQLSKRATYRTYASIDIHSYQLKQMKLPAGTIPEDSPRILISDSTAIYFQWEQEFSTVPFEDQEPGAVFGTSSDSVLITIPESEVEYDDPTADVRIALAEVRVHLSQGEYQFQIRTSLWNATYNKAVWSQLSDAMGLYVDYTTDPAAAPRNLVITL